MSLGRRTPSPVRSLRRILLRATACCLAPFCVVEPVVAQTLTAQQPLKPLTALPPGSTSNVAPAPPSSTPPTTTVPQPPAISTDPNAQLGPNPVGPNAVAQVNAPNFAVRAPANNRQFSIARVPNMIGDLTGGGGAQIQTTGFLGQTISHPSLTNGRLNIAENNSPVIGDRAYLTHRHFEAASSIDYLNGTPTGGAASQNIDRVMFGIERQLGDTNSLELRLPFNGQLDSNLLFTQFAAARQAIPYNTTSFELGNVNLIFKQALLDLDDFYLSAGLGLNLPTAPDVKVRTRIVDPTYQAYDFTRNPPALIGTVPLNLDLQTAVRNQTVNLSPYFSAAFRPSERVFAQGFLQCDLPLNRSSVSVDEFYIAANNPARQSFRGDLQQQILLRANVGAGRWWRYRDSSRFFHSIATMFEVHYTTSLNDAETTGPFRLGTTNPALFTQTTVGNLANRIDVVNLTAGVPMVVGLTTVTNALTLPIRGELNRSFDFEYSLLIDRRF